MIFICGICTAAIAATDLGKYKSIPRRLHLGKLFLVIFARTCLTRVDAEPEAPNPKP